MTITRCNALTTTTVAAVAAAVPSIASAKAQPASAPLATQRVRDQAVRDLAARMPADARAWIDTADIVAELERERPGADARIHALADQ